MTTVAEVQYEVREDAPRAAIDDCVAILNATRDHASSAERFEWLYLDNPDGYAVVWTVCDADSDAAVGFTAALPRRMLVQGEIRTCWVGADFSMLPAFRSLGLALKLRRAAKDAIDDGRVDFLYSHPNDRMAVIHSKVGHRRIGTMVRLAKPLCLGPFVAERTSSQLLGTAAGWLIDPARRWTDSAARDTGQYAVLTLDPIDIDERFDTLFWDSVDDGYPVIGIRDGRYLRWRYAANPLYRTKLLIAEKAGQLAGYALSALEGNEVHIKDLFPMHDGEVLAALVGELTRIGYRSGWRSLSMTLLESNPLKPLLTALGFRERGETTQMFGYCPEDRPWASAVHDCGSWRLTVGDRDV